MRWYLLSRFECVHATTPSFSSRFLLIKFSHTGRGSTCKISRSHIFMNGWYIHIYSLPFINVRNDRLIGVKALESMCKIDII